MKKQILTIIGVLVFLIPLISCSADQKPLTVFLVRHGEKVDNSKDPDLSIAGHERASKLANILKDAEIEYIHSTNANYKLKAKQNIAAASLPKTCVMSPLYDRTLDAI